MKKPVVVALALLVVLGLAPAGLAAPSLGLGFQTGKADFVLGVGGDDLKYSVTLPPYVLTVGESVGPWRVTGFYSASDDLSATVDPYSWEISYDKQDGSYQAFGLDLGYEFSLGGFAVQPKLGFRDTKVVAWGKDDPAVDGGWSGDSEGLEARGVRLAAEVAKAFGEKLTLRGEAGFSPALQGYELECYPSHDPAAGDEYEWYVWQPVGLKTSGSDLALKLEYKVSGWLTLNAAYRRATTNLKFDSWNSWLSASTGDGDRLTVSQINAGATVTF